MVPEKEEVNVLKMLIDISGRLARVEENTKGLHNTDTTAIKAFNLARKNEEDIKSINSTSTWAIRTAITAIAIPIVLMIVQRIV